MGDEAGLRLVLLAFSLAHLAVLTFYVRRAGPGTFVPLARQSEPVVSLLVVASYTCYAAGVVAFLIDPDLMAWSSVALPTGVRLLGVIALTAGLALLVWALHTLGGSLTISQSTRADQVLVTDGPYAHIRHPMYTAVLLAAAGVALLTANWFISACAAAFCAGLAYRSRGEEANLVAAFGEDYRRYRRRVPAFIPRPHTR